MKRTLTIFSIIVAFMLCANTNAFAQNNLKIGIGLAAGTAVERPGIKAGAVYRINNKIRGAVNLVYYLSDEQVFGININGHYIISDQPQTMVYGLAGLNISQWDGAYGVQYGNVGINIGFGGQYNLNFGALFTEVKYIVAGNPQVAASIGLRFSL